MYDKTNNLLDVRRIPKQNFDKGGSVNLPKANTGLISKSLKALNAANKGSNAFKNAANTINKVYVPNSTKTLLRNLNIESLGTLNSLSKVAAPVMMNPIRGLLLGAPVEGLGPFTGSPLNALPFYGYNYQSSFLPTTKNQLFRAKYCILNSQQFLKHPIRFLLQKQSKR